MTMSWTASTANCWALVAVPINPAPARPSFTLDYAAGTGEFSPERRIRRSTDGARRNGRDGGGRHRLPLRQLVATTAATADPRTDTNVHRRSSR